jgi:tRNA(Ile)-lysidine synthase TilS/MesJ
MRGVTLPPVIADALLAGAPLAVSVSGGKDSQAMLSVLKNLHRNAGGRWPGAIHAIHADLGRAEWPQTPGHVRFMCERLGVALTVVSRPQGDLLDEIRARVVSRSAVLHIGSEAQPDRQGAAQFAMAKRYPALLHGRSKA